MEGRLETCTDRHQWESICADEWDESEAKVACKELGYSIESKLLTSAILY